MRLLLADRVKGERDSFLAPLLPELARQYDTRFVSLPPGEALAEAIRWADLVWLEWCWDHAVWASRSGLLAGKRAVVRLHSIEALQTDFPARMNWQAVDRLVTVGEDITDLVREQLGTLPPIAVIPNGIDIERFAPGSPDRFRVAWVGHLEPKKNPMLLLQVAHRVRQADSRFVFHVAGAFTDRRTLRYLQQMVLALDLTGGILFDGHVMDMPAWYADKGVLLSTSMYESFGLNIGEAMATGAFPVVHAFPGACRLWPAECVFASTEEAVALIRSARPGVYRDWVAARYGLERQINSTLALLTELLGQSVP